MFLQRRARPRRAATAVFAFACVLAMNATAGSAPAPSISAPRGYSVALRRAVAPGLDRFVLTRKSPAHVVNVGRFTLGERYRLVPVLSQNAVSGPGRRTERTSAMCKRVRCLVAVNGDFFAAGVPVGGLIADSEILRTPAPGREQASVGADDRLALGPLHVSAAVSSTYRIVRTVAGIEAPFERTETRSFAVAGVNVPRDAGRVVLYTPRFGPRTETRANGAEVVVRVTSGGAPFRTGEATRFEPVSLRQGSGNSAIPRDGAVLSAHGEAARNLVLWWRDVQAGRALPESALRISSSPGAEQSISGNPVVLRDGKRAFPNSAFARSRAPRTILAWAPSGRVFLVTFDGRRPGKASGASLAQAADFVRALGATDAINLDGGGSTTFVMTGRVVNHPSDRLVRRGSRTLATASPRRGDRIVGYSERPVAVALAVVPAAG